MIDPLTVISWSGSLLILVGMHLIGAKDPRGPLFTGLGNVLWVIVASVRFDAPLVLVSLFAAVFGFRAFLQWQHA